MRLSNNQVNALLKTQARLGCIAEVKDQFIDVGLWRIIDQETGWSVCERNKDGWRELRRTLSLEQGLLMLGGVSPAMGSAISAVERAAAVGTNERREDAVRGLVEEWCLLAHQVRDRAGAEAARGHLEQVAKMILLRPLPGCTPLLMGAVLALVHAIDELWRYKKR